MRRAAAPAARPARLAMGLDGGGSKTACLIADECGQVLGWGLGGPTNINFVSRRTAAASIRRAVRQAVARCGTGRIEIAVACAAHAGPDWGAAARSVAPLQRACDIGEHESVRAACMGAGPGVVIIAGTGATVVAWDRRGRTIGVGGWGSPLGDEGGAYDTAMRAIRAAICGEDGRGQPTALGEAVREHFGVADLRGLCRVFYQESVPRHVVSRLCYRLFDLAHEGDAVARRVLEESARELATAACAAVRRLNLQRSGLDVVVAGGMTRAGRFLSGPLQRELRRTAPLAAVRQANREPVVGCLLLALSHLGHPVNEKLRGRVDAGMESLGLLGWPGPQRKPSR